LPRDRLLNRIQPRFLLLEAALSGLHPLSGLDKQVTEGLQSILMFIEPVRALLDRVFRGRCNFFRLLVSSTTSRAFDW
jgi:hypothetical protein